MREDASFHSPCHFKSAKNLINWANFTERWNFYYRLMCYEKSHHLLHFLDQRPFHTTGEYGRNHHRKDFCDSESCVCWRSDVPASNQKKKKPQDVFPQFVTVPVIACRGEKLAVR